MTEQDENRRGEELLLGEIRQLLSRLTEAEQALDAIRRGEVDAAPPPGSGGGRVFALTDSKNVYRVIVETMNEAALTLDLDGTILFANQQFARLIQQAAEEVVGRKVSNFVAPGQDATLSRVLTQARTGASRGRLVMQAKASGLVHVQLSANPLKGNDGSGICLVVSDLSELEDSARSNAVLRQHQQALEESQQALRLAKEDLQRSNQDLEQFAYAASHDLQEPLRGVSGFLRLLETRTSKGMDAKAREYISQAIHSAERMSTLIRDLLAYCQVDRKPVMRSRVDSGEALAGALANLYASIREAAAQVTHDPLPSVTADMTQLTQVFQNLIGNAIKFRKPNQPSLVHVAAEDRQGEIIFSVCDNGIGIPAEHHGRVFTIFQRLHGLDEYPGAGIGLAICKRIVDRHGGRIGVESKPGEGSRFFFSLPDGNSL
jgi:PAS domain S-box-containing protein